MEKLTQKQQTTNILNKLYNIIKNIDSVSNQETCEGLTALYLQNKNIMHKTPSDAENNKNILASLKLKNISKNYKNIINCIYLYNDYEIITNTFYMVFAPAGFYNKLNLNSIRNENAQNFYNRFYKNSADIENMQYKYNITINELLNDFIFNDYITIYDTTKTNYIILEKNNFIGFVSSLKLNYNETITLYGNENTKPHYIINNNNCIALILPCLKY